MILHVLDEGIVVHQAIDPQGIRSSFLVDALALLFEASVALSVAERNGSASIPDSS